MVFRPIGDLPPSVYWVRRLILLAVLLVCVAVVWWLWPNDGDDTSPTSDEPTPSATVSETPTDTETPEPSDSETKEKNHTSNKPECDDSAIGVTVSADAETYTADEQPAFAFTVENISDKTCSRDVGQDANELQVTSGGTQVWSSDDCSPGGDQELDTLKPGDQFIQTVTWPRVESSEGCPTPQEDAPTGTYQVIARNGDVLSEPAVFVLE